MWDVLTDAWDAAWRHSEVIATVGFAVALVARVGYDVVAENFFAHAREESERTGRPRWLLLLRAVAFESDLEVRVLFYATTGMTAVLLAGFLVG